MADRNTRSENMTTSTSADGTLKFVQADDSQEEHLRRAADCAREEALDVVWISAKEIVECEDLEPEDSVYVLDPFEGKHFDFLVENNCRIVGPQCIISCLQTMLPLPSNGNQPVYTVAMRGVYACCTGIPQSERVELHRLIHLMGGVVMKAFTDAVTHLVAGEVGSQKYKVACNFNKPVLLPAWVYRCWELGQKTHVCATDEEFHSFICPMFKGYTISATGLDSRQREDIQTIITENGGTFSGSLDMRTCTHLIADLPKGQKYSYARRWKLHCVSTQWIYDCVKCGYSLDEVSYYTLPEGGQQSFSSSSHLSTSRIDNTTTFSERSKTQRRNSKLASQAAYKSAQTLGDGDLIIDTSCKKKNSTRTGNTSKATHVMPNTALEDTNYNVSLQPGVMFLDGCKIFLHESSFSDSQMMTLRKIINAGGATRFNQINETVSHIVVGDLAVSDLDDLCQSEFQPFVVSVKWILNSAKEGKRLPEEEYLCSQSTPSPPSSCKENRAPHARDQEAEVPRQTSKNSSKQTKGKEDKPDDDDGENDVLLQYMTSSASNIPGISSNVPRGMTDPLVDGSEAVPMNVQDIASEAGPDQTADPEVTFDNAEISRQSSLLAGKQFYLDGFAEDWIQPLGELIESNGGQVVHDTQRILCDFAVLPMNKKPSEGMKAMQMVTFCWLEQVIDKQELLDPTDNFLFQPFSIPEGCHPLSNCVLTISQYDSTERTQLFQLAECLGATCQDHFARKANSQQQASTHLLCYEPSGHKYKAALKWGIPVVSVHWLFACAVSGKNEDPTDYPLGKVPDKPAAMTKSPRDSTGVDSGIAQTASDVVEKQVLVENPNFQPQMAGEDGEVQANPPRGLLAFRPSFDTADALAMLASPACGTPGLSRSRRSRSNRSSIGLDDYFAQNIQQALKNTEKLSGVKLPVGAKENGQEESGTSRGVLAGIVLAVSKKLNQQQTELCTLASSLGADYRWLYDESCTHLIHQGPMNDKSKEVAQARSRGAHVVSPHWLYSCEAEGKMVDESLYPPAYNPNLSLSVVTSGRRLTRSSKTSLEQSSSSKCKAQRHETIRREEVSGAGRGALGGAAPGERAAAATDVEENRDSADGQAAADPELSRIGSLEVQASFQRQVEAIMVATKGKGRRRSRHAISCSVENPGSTSPENNGGADGRRVSARIKARRSTTKSTSDRDLRSRSKMSDDSQQASDTITYDDPAGRLERERIMAVLKKGFSPSSDCDGQRAAGDGDGTTVLAENPSMATAHVEASAGQASTPVAPAKPDAPASPDSSATPAGAPVALPVREAVKPSPVNLLERSPPTASPTRARTPPKFHLSVMTPQEKIDYSALIEKLGGTVFDTVNFNPDCSHVVIGKPNRNEKYLAAVAAGKWLVRKSYLEASREAGFFVDEEKHEWGVVTTGEPVNKLAAAARRWRLKLMDDKGSARGAEESVGAFRGWTVLLCVDKSKQAGFKRLLEAGGAKVTSGRSPVISCTGVTHAFVGATNGRLTASDIEYLRSAGVPPLKPDYIADFLVYDPPPHHRRYFVSDSTGEPGENPSEYVNAAERKKRKAPELTGDEKRPRVD